MNQAELENKLQDNLDALQNHLQKSATSRNQPSGGGSPLIQLEPEKKSAPQKKLDK